LIVGLDPSESNLRPEGGLRDSGKDGWGKTQSQAKLHFKRTILLVKEYQGGKCGGSRGQAWKKKENADWGIKVGGRRSGFKLLYRRIAARKKAAGLYKRGERGPGGEEGYVATAIPETGPKRESSTDTEHKRKE